MQLKEIDRVRSFICMSCTFSRNVCSEKLLCNKCTDRLKQENGEHRARVWLIGELAGVGKDEGSVIAAHYVASLC
jgi:hypothetical protein